MRFIVSNISVHDKNGGKCDTVISYYLVKDIQNAISIQEEGFSNANLTSESIQSVVKTIISYPKH